MTSSTHILSGSRNSSIDNCRNAHCVNPSRSPLLWFSYWIWCALFFEHNKWQSTQACALFSAFIWPHTETSRDPDCKKNQLSREGLKCRFPPQIFGGIFTVFVKHIYIMLNRWTMSDDYLNGVWSLTHTHTQTHIHTRLVCWMIYRRASHNLSVWSTPSERWMTTTTRRSLIVIYRGQEFHSNYCRAFNCLAMLFVRNWWKAFGQTICTTYLARALLCVRLWKRVSPYICYILRHLIGLRDHFLKSENLWNRNGCFNHDKRGLNYKSFQYNSPK